MISIRRISLGDGFRYLMESVAAGDTGVRPADGLAAYYASSGTPPGRFLGEGLSDLGRGTGIQSDSQVTEQQLRRMLGAMCDPVSGEAVGSTPILSGKKSPVAGFDLTFSPSKSVSVVWALADPGTKAVIYDCHRQAIEYVLDYAERHVFRSRSGPRGIVEEDVTGIIAAAFTHWDSRAADPQLHDHVVVWNRAKSVSDGRWRTLDSRGLFRAAVMLSELHQGVLSDRLTGALGVGWDGHERRHSDHHRFEIAGVPALLMEKFSQRAEQVQQRTAELTRQFVSVHGRHPTSVEGMKLAQQATLETRPQKAHRSLAEMTTEWRQRAGLYVGDDAQQLAWVASLCGRNDLPLLRSVDLAEPILVDGARAARDAVSSRRATFTRYNVTAEALRLLHGVRFATPDERVAVVERIVALALDESLLLNSPALLPVPAAYLRSDGTSRLHPESRKLYTTQTMLDAEVGLLEAGRRLHGPSVSRQVVAQVTGQQVHGARQPLSLDQAFAVEKIATSGRCLDVLVGPAGTGKSTTMATLRAVWEAEYGPGSVIGLAPSAAAADALSAELDIDTENTAKWLHEWRQVPELVATRQRVDATATSHAGAGPASVEQLRRQVGDLEAAIDARCPRPGQLIIVDEASLAGTLVLDELVTAATEGGAKVLLVGDPAQLSSVEAGGAFRLVADDRGDMVPQLTDVRRFTNDWEKGASLRLRRGDVQALEDYEARGRIAAGNRDVLIETLYANWKNDVDAGLTSLMITPDSATAAELNRRARQERVRSGSVHEQGARISNGDVAGVGDFVVTRQNDRRISVGGRWVKNGDRWIVAATRDDGSITVRSPDRPCEAVLPAAYVAEHVKLAYATTAYQAQGRTVDSAHAFVSPSTTREVLYVSATRGRESNRLYVDTCYDPDPDTGHEGVMKLQGAREVLGAVLANEGAELSAHEMLRRLHSDEEVRTRMAWSASSAWPTTPDPGLAVSPVAGPEL